MYDAVTKNWMIKGAVAVVFALGVLLFIKALSIYAPGKGDFGQELRAFEQLRQGESIYGVPNAHPPFNIILLYPLSVLSPRVAFVVLGILSAVLFYLSLLFVVRGLNVSTKWIFPFFAVSLLTPNFYSCIGLGTVSSIVTFFIIGSWYFGKRKMEILSGAFLGFAVLIKPYPAFLLVFFIITRRWRSLMAALFTVVAGTCLSIVCFGLNTHKIFLLEIVPFYTFMFKPFPFNTSIIGAVHRVIGPQGDWVRPLVQAPGLTFILVSLLLAGLCIWLFRESLRIINRENSDYAFSMLLAGMLLVSPLSWGHYYLVLMLPFILLLKDFVKVGTDRKLLIMAAIICLSGVETTIMLAIAKNYLPASLVPWQATFIALLPTIGLLLLAVLIRQQSLCVNEK